MPIHDPETAALYPERYTKIIDAIKSLDMSKPANVMSYQGQDIPHPNAVFKAMGGVSKVYPSQILSALEVMRGER